jgi:hypothetical protein
MNLTGADLRANESPDVAAAGSNVYVVWSSETRPSGTDITFRRSTDEGGTFETGGLNLSGTSGNSLRPRVAAVGSDIYVVWEDDTGTPGIFEILFLASHDGGMTWEQPAINLSNTKGRNSRHPAIAVAGPDVYVAWEETVPARTGPDRVVIWFRRSIDEGAHFDPPANVSTDVGADKFNPALAATGSAVYVAWNDQPGLPARPQVFFLSSLGEGESGDCRLCWNTNAIQNISQSTGTAQNPSVAAVGARVFVAWDDDSGSPGVPKIVFSHSVDQGTSFFQPAQDAITPSSTLSVAPRAAAAGSVFSFVWTVRPLLSLVFSQLFLSTHETLSELGPTSTWPVQEITATFSGFSGPPNIAMTGSKFYVVWRQQPSGSSSASAAIMFMRSTPSNGVAPVNLSLTSGRPSVTANVAVEGSDVYVAWSESEPTRPPDVLFRASHDGGKTFTNPVINLSNNPGTSSNPKVAVSGPVVYVVWEDDSSTPGVPDIVFRRSLDRGVVWDPPLDQLPIDLSEFRVPQKLVSRSPTVAASGGELYVAWEDDTKKEKTEADPLDYESPQIFFRRSLVAALPLPLDRAFDPPLDASPEQLSCRTGPGRELCKGRMPSLASAGSNVYLTFQEDSNGTEAIEFCVSNNQQGPSCGGGTTTDTCGGPSLPLDKKFPFGPAPENPITAAVGSSAYVVWLKGGEIYFRAAQVGGRPGGGGGADCLWAPSLDLSPAHLSFDHNASHPPVIAAAGEEVYVAWPEDIVTGGGVVGPFIRFLRSLDQGATFQLLHNLLSPTSARGPWLAATGPEVYLVWQETESLATRCAPIADEASFIRCLQTFPIVPPLVDEVFMRSSTDQGATFPDN